jgi:hypothetical protein
MSEITAVVLSATEKEFSFDGWKTLNHVSQFNTAEELHFQRLEAIKKVNTPYFAYVDDDDSLVENTAEQMQRLISLMKKNQHCIGYTDYKEKAFGGTTTIRPGKYVPVKHYTNVMLMHHLVVVQTDKALELLKSTPLGLYWTEYLLYAPLARNGVTYLEEVAYIWHMKTTGMHVHKDAGISQKNSLKWYIENYPLNL